MTCGIYQLDFDSGHFYIGKSINMEERWKQHFINFEKGTAAQAMQRCFNDHGYPDTKFLITCHPDHLDVLEPLFINMNYNSAYCLNSDRPTIHQDVGEWVIDTKVHELLKMSTHNHINEILDLKLALVQKEREHNKEKQKIILDKDAEIYGLKVLPQIMDAIDLEKEVAMWQEKIDHAEYMVKYYKENMYELDKKLEKEKAKPWWTKFWE